ncbi:MAG TPA: ATP-binding protein, partial [Streptosporangiaceae bacterium]|nr:ATP-binding protein [Streptosporangiaceae bacterium]
RMVFERAPIGISVGRNGMMTETNPALQRMLGYSGAELARTHYSAITVADEYARAAQDELDTGARDSFSVEKQYLRRDGTALDARIHVVLDFDDGLGMSMIEDVTEQRALEAQLLQTQRMDAVGTLAGGVAHDFNNLMTAVIGYSDLLLRGGDSDAGQGAKLEAIRDAAVRASDLTRQLLAFSRRQVLQVDEIDLRDVVNRMEILLRRLLGEQIRLETSFASEPVIVRTDPRQLEQVVVNLAANARDAMPEGGTLTVTVLSDGEEAVLTVTDDGIGMDENTRARIFEPFFTTKPLVAGAGLGLSTVHGIVGQSGGSIEVESVAGGGSTFTVRLPLASASRLPAAVALATVVD